MFSLPKLPYSYAGLEPAISAEIMELHHLKHHQAYVDKLNAAIEEMGDVGADKSITQILQSLDKIPESVRSTVQNNGGGHYNHSLFWECMIPGGSELSDGVLRHLLENKYGSMNALIDTFSSRATGLFGSGWVWLMPNGDVVTTPNQDSPIMDGSPEPLLGLDVWEHAYYLDYKNVKADYIKQWWSVVNWKFVQQRYDTLMSD